MTDGWAGLRVLEVLEQATARLASQADSSTARVRPAVDASVLEVVG